MQFGDTADCKSAPRERRDKNLCKSARSWEIALQSRQDAKQRGQMKFFAALRLGGLALKRCRPAGAAMVLVSGSTNMPRLTALGNGGVVSSLRPKLTVRRKQVSAKLGPCHPRRQWLFLLFFEAHKFIRGFNIALRGGFLKPIDSLLLVYIATLAVQIMQTETTLRGGRTV